MATSWNWLDIYHGGLCRRYWTQYQDTYYSLDFSFYKRAVLTMSDAS